MSQSNDDSCKMHGHPTLAETFQPLPEDGSPEPPPTRNDEAWAMMVELERKDAKAARAQNAELQQAVESLNEQIDELQQYREWAWDRYEKKEVISAQDAWQEGARRAQGRIDELEAALRRIMNATEAARALLTACQKRPGADEPRSVGCPTNK